MKKYADEANDVECVLKIVYFCLKRESFSSKAKKRRRKKFTVASGAYQSTFVEQIDQNSVDIA